MFRILVSDKLGVAGVERLEQTADVTYDLKTDLSRKELLAIIHEYDALIVRSGTKVDGTVLAAADKLKIIGRAGMGVDNIDVHAATMRGIVVMNTPGANSIATAEQTMGLMLAVSRHTAEAHASVKAGHWNRSRLVGVQLYDKVLGIIGVGRIGRLVAQRAQAFGMEVLAYDPYVSEEIGRELDITLADLEDLLPQSDYITLHAALLPETESMINADTISQMKDGVILINTARGKIIDEQALADGLKSGKIKAAALDVYSAEPPQDNPLIGLPNVLHTPHLGANTVEAQQDVATQIVEQVLNALRGLDFRNAINMPFPAGPEFVAVRPYMRLAEKLGSLHAGLANKPIRRVEIEVQGETVHGLVRGIAAALLKGLLESALPDPVNYINAPMLAREYGITVSQTRSSIKGIDYPNLISCRVEWDDGERLLAGVLFGGSEPRIVRVNEHELDARPEGVVLIMQNQDIPGVIGQIGTILAAYEVNIGEWRMGRDRPGGKALSFINLDSEPPAVALNALERISAVTQLKLITLEKT